MMMMLMVLLMVVMVVMMMVTNWFGVVVFRSFPYVAAVLIFLQEMAKLTVSVIFLIADYFYSKSNYKGYQQVPSEEDNSQAKPTS